MVNFKILKLNLELKNKNLTIIAKKTLKGDTFNKI